jgi:hypothetical protein
MDLEEFKNQEKYKKNIEIQINISNIISEIKKNKINFENIKELYIKERKLYIFEIKELEEIFEYKEKIKELNKSIEEKEYSNIFILLNLIKEEIPENIIIELKKLFKKNKEYKNLLNDYMYIKNKTGNKRNQIKINKLN